MNITDKLFSFCRYVCRFNFGEFDEEEFKKFIRMGFVFILIIGVYWTLRPLKDAIFIHLVDRMQLPYAKTVSVLGLLPLVMVYTKLLGKISREKMLLMLPTVYGIATLGFAAVILGAQASVEQIEMRSLPALMATKVLGYTFYLFVESFGSLAPALFWAFATDATEPTSAKRGFALVYAFGQLGGVIFPYSIGGLPHRLGLETDALSLLFLGCLILLIIPMVRHFLRTTPAHLLTTAYREKGEEK